MNRQYSKEEYKKLLLSIDMDSSQSLDALKQQFYELKLRSLRKATESQNVRASSGSYLRNTKNCKQCFDLFEAEDCGFLAYGSNVKDSFDGYGTYPTTELCYEVVGAGSSAYGCKFSYLPWDNASNLEYCVNVLFGGHNCFGCVQIVHNKSYCILNKQYTKEEYEKLVPKIIDHMNSVPYIDKKGRIYRYGEFFPSELSPFSYNETIAQEYFPLTKEEALEQGYLWKDPEPRNYQIQIPNSKLPDHIKDVSDDIIGQIIECGHNGKCNEQCTEAFKIIPQELEFYKKMNLPVPRLCPNCRHYRRIKQRNPLKLWHSKCMCAGTTSDQQSATGFQYQNTATHRHGTNHCPEEFETSYAPERPEIVYCEACYQQEVI